MEDKLIKLEEYITQLAANPEFIHHKWFIKWHLKIVEQICIELCEAYPNADKNIIKAMVWMHDYAKIIDFDNEHDMAVTRQGVKVLQDLGFEDEFINRLMEAIELFESKMTVDLSTAPIEIQIMSSADAASHMIGPFFSIYWYENTDKSIEELMAGNMKKLAKDWDRKIVLPEVKQLFKGRHDYLAEMFGNLPEKFLD